MLYLFQTITLADYFKKTQELLVYGKMLLYLRTTKQLYMNRNNLHIILMCATGRMSLYTSATGMTPRG